MSLSTLKDWQSMQYDTDIQDAVFVHFGEKDLDNPFDVGEETRLVYNAMFADDSGYNDAVEVDSAVASVLNGAALAGFEAAVLSLVRAMDLSEESAERLRSALIDNSTGGRRVAREEVLSAFRDSGYVLEVPK